MNTFLKTIVLTTAVAATTLSTIPSASAGDRHRHHRHHERSGGISAGELAAIGVFGLAAGAIASSIVTAPPPPRGGQLLGPVDGYGGPAYDEPDYRGEYGRDYYPDAPEPRRPRHNDRRYSQRGGLEPWSREWFEYCDDRYNTFNPRTGTYRGYDGRDHFCSAG